MEQKFDVALLGSSSFFGKNFQKFSKIKKIHCFQRDREFLIKKYKQNLIGKNFHNNLKFYLEKNNITFLINLVSNNNNKEKISKTEKKKIIYSNYLFHKKTLASLKNYNVKVINFSSSEVIRKNNLNYYRKSKKLLSNYIKLYKKIHKYRIINLNIPNIFGPYDRNLNRIIPYLIHCKIYKISPKILNKKKKLNLVFSKDLVLNIDKYIKYGEKIKLITYNESISNIYKFIFFKKGLRDKIFEAKLRITLNWYKKNL